MTVKLEFYQIDENNNQKIKLNNDVLSFGNMFKGNQKRVPITIFNSGDTPAVSPVISIQKYPVGDYEEAFKWKKISFDKSQNFQTSLNLPDIMPGKWLTGKTIQYEDFNNYPPIAGTKPDQAWLLWEGTAFGWEVYNGWLQHNVDTMDGRALWTDLSQAKDFTFSMKVTIRDGVYGGVILRDEGDSNTGYIVLVQAIQEYLGDVVKNEGVIQVFTGRFTDGIKAWREIYKSPTIGQRGTHDFFKVRLTGNKFEFWYKNDNESPLYTFIDEGEYHKKASKPVICVHAGFGSVLTYFDEIYMEVVNEDGVVWIENTVDQETPVFSTQYSVLNVEYGGV